MHIIVHLRSGGKIVSDEFTSPEFVDRGKARVALKEANDLLSLMKDLPNLGNLNITSKGSDFYIHPHDISYVEFVGLTEFMTELRRACE